VASDADDLAVDKLRCFEAALEDAHLEALKFELMRSMRLIGIAAEGGRSSPAEGITC
jgi:hypothetical protein